MTDDPNRLWDYNLTVAIPTVAERRTVFSHLHALIAGQIAAHGLESKVELIYLSDNKEISIGAKRQKLYEKAKGKFCVQIDDDDGVHNSYVKLINDCIEHYPGLDAIGYIEHCTIDGQVFLAHHSNRWADWGQNGVVDGRVFPYLRTPFFKDPIRTDICLAIGVNDMRYGEDQDFAGRLKASGLIKRYVDIPLALYYYRYSAAPHAEKYGFT